MTMKDTAKEKWTPIDPFEPLGPEAETIALSTIELADGRVVGRSQQVEVEAEGIVSFGLVVWRIDGSVVNSGDAKTALLARGSTSIRPLRRFKRFVRDWIWTAIS